MKRYYNQKIIEIVKEPADTEHPYTILNVEALDKAARDLPNSAFKLYVYLASNRGGYLMGLSKQDFTSWANVQENTYRSAVKSLEEKGYLVQGTDRWYFFENPETEF